MHPYISAAIFIVSQASCCVLHQLPFLENSVCHIVTEAVHSSPLDTFTLCWCNIGQWFVYVVMPTASVLVFLTEMKMWKIVGSQTPPLSDLKVFFKWALWKLFLMKHLEVILLKVKHTVSLCFWSGFSPNIAEVSLTASKTELRYYWLSDENAAACSESRVHVVKPFQMLKLQLLETDQCHKAYLLL